MTVSVAQIARLPPSSNAFDLRVEEEGRRAGEQAFGWIDSSRCCAWQAVLSSSETSSEPSFTTAMSGRPSRLKSATTAAEGR